MKKTLLFWVFSLGLVVALSACQSASSPVANCDTAAQATESEACLLSGYLVKNPQGELLGQVKRVFVDPDQGQVTYVALAFEDPGVHSKGAMVAAREQITLIPWEMFTPVAGEDVLLLNMADRRALIDLPHFGQLPENVSPELAAEIRAHWAKTE